MEVDKAQSTPLPSLFPPGIHGPRQEFASTRAMGRRAILQTSAWAGGGAAWALALRLSADWWAEREGSALHHQVSQ